jgi:hypothetical protein
MVKTSGDDHFKVFQAQENNNAEVMHFIFSALIFRKDSCSYSCVCVCIVDEFLRHACAHAFLHVSLLTFSSVCLPVRQYSLSISDIANCLRYMCPLLHFHYPTI